MTIPPQIDPERLAALLDGRLNEADAAAPRAQLAACDDDTLAAYADAVAIVAESDVGNGVVPIRSAPSRRRILPWITAAAAIFIGVVLIRPNGTGTGDPIDRAQGYARLISSASQLPTTPVWGVTRGTTLTLNTQRRSARLGALLTDVEVALDRKDPLYRTYLESIAAITGDVPGSAGATARLRAAASTRTLIDAATVRALVREGLQGEDAGIVSGAAWIEAARLASSAGDTTFLRRNPAPEALGLIEQSAQLDSTQRAALVRTRNLAQSSSPHMSELQAQLTELLRALTR